MRYPVNFLATKKILKTNQLLTQYSEVESIMYNSEPCQLKTLWKSTRKDHHSLAFPKGKVMKSRYLLRLMLSKKRGS